MQLSELYRRGVVRPLTKDSALQMGQSSIRSPIAVELLSVIGDDQFGILWGSGVFQQINKSCAVRISDYEEVELSANLIMTARTVVGQFKAGSSLVDNFRNELLGMMDRAVRDGSPIYFIF